MKITVLGAAGVRTPLLVQAILMRHERIGLQELALMDINGDRLELIGAITRDLELQFDQRVRILRTTDPVKALEKADFVITTFRVGGIESRAIDERVPLSFGVLGQETTGAGGFSMGIRSIPVILGYVDMMKKLCPDAWLINFANPSGMLTEAVVRYSSWQRVVGICDAPASMQRVIASILGGEPDDIYLDYFGLNHLGWIKGIIYKDHDHLPGLLKRVQMDGNVVGLPFDSELVYNLGLIPNEYLFYYYYRNQAIKNILNSAECRGEQITRLNHQLWESLESKFSTQDWTGMARIYHSYLDTRSSTYMETETKKAPTSQGMNQDLLKSLADHGYAGVALDLIEALIGNKSTIQILNIPNHGVITEMDVQDVVEIPARVGRDSIQAMFVGNIPAACTGLIKLVKHYEHLTIEAVIEKSYQKALQALTLHPLIQDYLVAKAILDEYISKHQQYFPVLQ